MLESVSVCPTLTHVFSVCLRTWRPGPVCTGASWDPSRTRSASGWPSNLKRTKEGSKCFI